MKCYVAGHTGMVGRAVSVELERHGLEPWHAGQVDLRREDQAMACLRKAADEGVSAVVLAAARVGGIGANSSEPVAFLQDNLRIAMNVICGAHQVGIERLVNLGSSCIYPRDAPQPIPETALLTGPLEPTNEPYALAKIAAIKLVCAYRREHGARYISLMPCNLYGPGDRYDPRRSHVIPALIGKFEQARRRGTPVRLWGTGAPRREFLHVHDLARAVVFALLHYDDDMWLNVGGDDELTIRELASLVARVTGYDGVIQWDPSMPDGTPRKKLDDSRLRALGWRPRIPLADGLREVVEDFRRAPWLASLFEEEGRG